MNWLISLPQLSTTAARPHLAATRGYIETDMTNPLRDDDVRNAAILEVVERNSIIEGLPRLSQAFRQRVGRKYRSLYGQQPKKL